MALQKEIEAVVHLSSTAVFTLVGYFDAQIQKTKVMALGVANTDSFFGGQIQNRQHLLSAVHKSIHEASDMAGLEISKVKVSFASPSMVSANNSVNKEINNGGASATALSAYDIRSLVKQAHDKLAKKSLEPVQICQQLFWLDDGRDVKDAIGMITNKVTMNYHEIGLPYTLHAQIKEIFDSNNLAISTMLFDGVVCADNFITEDEKKQGICFVDIGAATTKVCLYNDGLLLYSKCYPVGGQIVDFDIASVLKLTLKEAESLKKHHGFANASRIDKRDFITLKKKNQNSERTVLSYELASIIEARYLAIFQNIMKDISQAGLEVYMSQGFVLAGGASDILELPSLIEQQLGINARKAQMPNRVSVCPEFLSDDNVKILNDSILDPKLHSVLSTLLYSQSEQYARDEGYGISESDQPGAIKSFFSKMMAKIVSIV